MRQRDSSPERSASFKQVSSIKIAAESQSSNLTEEISELKAKLEGA